jgi:mono/diheme cytochrome c family protein
MSKRHKAAILLVFCGLLSGAVVALGGCRSAPALTSQEEEGKKLYSVRCAHCHADNDLALKKIPPDLHGVFARTTLPSGTPASDGEVRRVVLSGKGMMPSFAGRFTDEQMEALLAYLHAGLR